MKNKSALLLVSILLFVLVGCLAGYYFIGYIDRLNRGITEKFDGTRWSLPAVVYARPLELYVGLQLSPEMLEQELRLGEYRQEDPVSSAGGYSRRGEHFSIMTRDFTFPSGREKSSAVTVSFTGSRISALRSAVTAQPLSFVRLDPARIGSFHPLVHEDRLVLQASEVPTLLRDALIAVEDKDFYSHYGVSPSGIVRALLANLKAGRTTQGGSTLTQQLVKNFFLNQERTLSRKAREAIMAILLEYNYSKDEILTAYINEVFLGQDGARAIHGFSLASRFYFRRDLADLSVAQTATLVGLVKGPSYYDPRRHPERATARRGIVLSRMHGAGLISPLELERALAEPLSDVAPQTSGFNRFPAFLELVKRQLSAEYKQESLESNGLVILTTLDPQVQWQVERQLGETIAALEQQTGTSQLQGAMLVTGRENGEIAAVAGGRQAGAAGFNRALDAYRQIGSLVKPAVYLTALTKGYHLATPLLDAAVGPEYNLGDWQPRNYDQKEHGSVPLYAALARSYNLATVRLGLDLGLEQVISTIGQLGYAGSIKPYPSLLLGAFTMSPLEITQLYQTIGAGGFFMPLRSISGVIAADGTLLTRYSLQVEQRFSPETIFLLSHALERVMTEGTGHRAGEPDGGSYAGKTGTTDDLRDSWFAGFSSDRLAVTWLGRDDNQPIGITGSGGALIVWKKVMKTLGASLVQQTEPDGIVWSRIDMGDQGARSAPGGSTILPFVAGTEPRQTQQPVLDMRAIEQEGRRFLDKLKGIFK